MSQFYSYSYVNDQQVSFLDISHSTNQMSYAPSDYSYLSHIPYDQQTDMMTDYSDVMSYHQLTEFDNPDNHSIAPAPHSPNTSGESLAHSLESPDHSDKSQLCVNETVISRSARQIRKLPIRRTVPKDQQVTKECQKCGKKIDHRNKTRHSAFHSKLFRFECKECDYKSHLRHNMSTHIRFKHGGVADFSEKKSIDLAKERTRVYAECFGGYQRNHALRILSGQKEITDLSFLADSIVTNISTGSDISMLIEPEEEAADAETIECLGEQTVSSRVVTALKKGKAQKCQKCSRFVGPNKKFMHAMIHSHMKRFRCSECGVCHGYKQNLQNHIRVAHHNGAHVIDELNDEMKAEFERLVRECFPETKRTRAAYCEGRTPDAKHKVLAIEQLNVAAASDFASTSVARHNGSPPPVEVEVPLFQAGEDKKNLIAIDSQ
ncbi:unnamed protein product, partial [Mesorhabditis spiculigera]